MKNREIKMSRKPIFIMDIILTLIICAGMFVWLSNADYESTDDAQLEGNIYSIRSGVTAYLNNIAFSDNQYVQKGDTLFVFDTIGLNAKIKQAEAGLESAKAGLTVSDMQALASMQNAKASFQTALSGKEAITSAKAGLEKAQNDFNRDEKLLQINAITPMRYDADKAVLAQALAAYKRSVNEQQYASITSTGLRSQANAAHHQITAAMALVEGREAALVMAKEDLSHAFIIAPCNGIVTRRSVDPGQYILAGQSLCSVVDEQHLWVSANFKETKLNKIKIGQSVTISIDAYPKVKLKGIVQSFGGATGAKFSLIPPDNATGNFIKVVQRFPLRIQILSFSDSINKLPVLFPGLSAFVKVETN